MDSLFVGIDVAKAKFDVCILDQEHEVVCKHEVFANTQEGITAFLKWLASYPGQPSWVCLEHTGYYGALLTQQLSAAGLRLCLLNPLELKRSIGLTRGKNDVVDAHRIASYAVSHTHKLQSFTLTNEDLQLLKVLLTQRAMWVKTMVQHKNSLKGLQVRAQSLDVESCMEEERMFIGQYQTLIKKLERKMMAIIKPNQALKRTYQQITSIPGVGIITAVACITETDNFQCFANARKFCAHAGLAPFEYQSGSSIKAPKRTSKLRKKAIKTLLIRAGMVASRHDPQLKAYKKRKKEQGKNPMVIKNALAAKVTARIFAVANRQEPFVKLAA